MKNLIGKRFELTEAIECEGDMFSSLRLVGDDAVVTLEADAIYAVGDNPIGVRASIESLVEPAPGEEVMTDVFGGNFVAAPL